MAETRREIERLEQARRIVALPIAGERRYVAVEDAARYRDALGTPLPPGLPEALLEPVRDPAGDLVLRFARSHGPFNAQMFAPATASASPSPRPLLKRLAEAGRLIEGEFRPGGTDREWVRRRRASPPAQPIAARLRQQVEPVETDALGRFLVSWHGIGSCAAAPTRCSTRSSSCRVPAHGVGARTRDPAVARRRLSAGDARHADGRRRSGLGRRRAARRSRRTNRAVPHGSSPTLPAARARRPAKASPGRRATAGRPRLSARARRVVLRRNPSRPWARAFRRRPSTRCGIWSGGAWSPTTRCTRCAR